MSSRAVHPSFASLVLAMRWCRMLALNVAPWWSTWCSLGQRDMKDEVLEAALPWRIWVGFAGRAAQGASTGSQKAPQGNMYSGWRSHPCHMPMMGARHRVCVCIASEHYNAESVHRGAIATHPLYAACRTRPLQRSFARRAPCSTSAGAGSSRLTWVGEAQAPCLRRVGYESGLRVRPLGPGDWPGGAFDASAC